MREQKTSGLDPRTIELIKEFYGGHVCTDCGAPAQRFTVGKFYCADCFEIPSDPTKADASKRWTPPVAKDPNFHKQR